MQLHTELDAQASEAEATVSSRRKRDRLVTRKVTVRLTEGLHNQLEAATDRPGVGKSMVVAAALERFLNPISSADGQLRERLDDMNLRFDRLDELMRKTAETVAAHARHHLAVMSPLPQPEQHEASVRGDEHFRVLDGEVDRRVRLDQPLTGETIEHRNSAECAGSEPATREDTSHSAEPRQNREKSGSGSVDIDHASFAAAGEGGSISYFRYCGGPNSLLV